MEGKGRNWKAKKGNGWGFSMGGGCGGWSFVCFVSYFDGGGRGVFVWLDLII